MREPTGRGYVEALAGWGSGGLFGRLEAGWHPIDNASLFGFAELDRAGPMAGAGVRVEF